MRALLFASRSEAERAVAAIDASRGLPRVHLDDEYAIGESGQASLRIRAHGVRTGSAVPIVPNADGSRFAVPVAAPDAVEIDLAAWRSEPVRPSREG